MSNSKNDKYLLYIAYAQVIGIILVVLGHSFHMYPENHGENTIAYRMIYNFHMPLFIFVSGFLMRYTSFKIKTPPPELRKFFISKAKRLLYPLFFISILLFVPRHFMSGYADDASPLTLKEFFVCFLYGSKLPIPYFWFLHFDFVALAVSYPVFWICNKRRFPLWPAYIFLCGIYATSFLPGIAYSDFFSLYIFHDLYLYFLLGCLYCDLTDRFGSPRKLGSISFCLGLIALWCVIFFLTEDAGPIFAAIATLTGIAMCLAISMLIEHKGWRFLDTFTGANYMIYLLSWFVNVTAQQMLSHFVDWPWWVHTILSFTGGIIIPWCVYKYLMSHAHRKWVRTALSILGHPIKKIA